MGYHRAGFEVVGVDINPQPHYPFEFHQADALEFCAAHSAEFDVIHASPVCKGYSNLRSLWKNRTYPDQIGELRQVLKATGKPYVIENVPGAPLFDPLLLCGSMFGLRVYRHRLFECNPKIDATQGVCNHWAKASGNRSLKAQKRVTPNLTDFDILTVTGHDFIVADARIAMGIDWMTRDELSQAIPPAYTQWLGTQIITRLRPNTTYSRPRLRACW